MEQGSDGFRLAPEAERVGGLLPDRGVLEGERLDQDLEGHRAVLPAVGDRRAQRGKEQDESESEDAPQVLAFPDHAVSIPESRSSC